MRNNWKLNGSFAVAVAASLMCVAGAAKGAVADPNIGVFFQPGFFGQANTTYQEWNGFSSATGSNAPTDASTFGSTASWTDTTAATDGAFLIGSAPNGHVYSFGGNLNPQIHVPGLGLGSGVNTSVVLQVESQGSPIDPASFALLADGSGAVGVTPTISDASIPLGGTFGGTQDVYDVEWLNVPGNAAGYTINYSPNTTSSSQLAARVDTIVSVPEPESIAMLAAAAVALRSRKRNRPHG
jgi:hypothetical protein